MCNCRGSEIGKFHPSKSAKINKNKKAMLDNFSQYHFFIFHKQLIIISSCFISQNVVCPINISFKRGVHVNQLSPIARKLASDQINKLWLDAKLKMEKNYQTKEKENHPLITTLVQKVNFQSKITFSLKN